MAGGGQGLTVEGSSLRGVFAPLALLLAVVVAVTLIAVSGAVSTRDGSERSIPTITTVVTIEIRISP